MNKKIIASSLLTIFGAVAISTANAADRKGPPPGGGKPPTEAFEACADKSTGDSCSFTASRGDATGSCIKPPRGDEELVCAPEGGRPPQ